MPGIAYIQNARDSLYPKRQERSTSVTSDRTEKLGKVNFWNELLALRDRQREQQKTAVQVVRRGELPLESNSQGLMRWYLHPSITDTVLSSLTIFEQEIPPGGRSGRLGFQGGQVIFIIEGNGYTLIDGVKHQWKSRDVLNLPLKKDGIVVQHFNSSPDKAARFLAVEPNLFAALGVDRGSGFEQMEPAPDFKP